MPEPNTAPKTVLMTGGSGFLGGWCIAALLDRGYSVRTTVRDLAREGHECLVCQSCHDIHVMPINSNGRSL